MSTETQLMIKTFNWIYSIHLRLPTSERALLEVEKYSEEQDLFDAPNRLPA